MRVQDLEIKTFSDTNRVEFIPEIPIKGSIGFWNIRRERSEIRAMVVISVDDGIVNANTFNVGRAEDREKLVKLAQANLSDVEKEAWSNISNHLLAACMWVATMWGNKHR